MKLSLCALASTGLCATAALAATPREMEAMIADTFALAQENGVDAEAAGGTSFTFIKDDWCVIYAHVAIEDTLMLLVQAGPSHGIVEGVPQCEGIPRILIDDGLDGVLDAAEFHSPLGPVRFSLDPPENIGERAFFEEQYEHGLSLVRFFLEDR